MLLHALSSTAAGLLVREAEMSVFEADSIEVSIGERSLPSALYRPVRADGAAGVLVAPGGLAKGEIEAYTWAGERLAQAGFVALVLTYSAPTPYGTRTMLSLRWTALFKSLVSTQNESLPWVTLVEDSACLALQQSIHA